MSWENLKWEGKETGAMGSRVKEGFFLFVCFLICVIGTHFSTYVEGKEPGHRENGWRAGWLEVALVYPVV